MRALPLDDVDHAAELGQAKAARARSQRALVEAEARRREASAVVGRLREQRRQNRFAERIAETFRDQP